MRIEPNETSNVKRIAGRFRECFRGRKHGGWLGTFGLLGLLGLLSGMVAGCETNHPAANPPAPEFLLLIPFPAQTNILHEADVISIDFRYSTNFNSVQKIGRDGLVNLPSAGEVMAAGKTVLQFQNELTERYKGEVKDDPITVKIIAAASAVYVTGAVSHPGKIVMDRPLTVVEAIAEAGGVDPYRAKLSKVSVMRVDDGRQKVYWLNLNRAFEGEDPDVFYLKPFDVVRVPTKTFNF
ncbi:MAG TPA: polysaccharide biosynthesis/export family protein [Verrucomicrobiae bacterium]|jgi:polysaccharide export outer membrane protein|nr:polysaccharide biosynthesis/export family protein [Verrucomicrobiae bacterium]